MKKSDTVYQVVYFDGLFICSWHAFFRKQNAEKFASKYEDSVIIEWPRYLLESIRDFRLSLKKALNNYEK